MSFAPHEMNLKGGVLYRASGSRPVTARSWTANLGLELGQRSGDSHPKYDLIDVVRLKLMMQLTDSRKVQANIAASIVQQLQDSLPGIVREIISEAEESGKWKWGGGPFVVINDHMPAPRRGASLIRICDTADEVAAILNGTDGLPTLIIIKLRQIVNSCRFHLMSIADGNMMVDDE